MAQRELSGTHCFFRLVLFPSIPHRPALAAITLHGMEHNKLYQISEGGYLSNILTETCTITPAVFGNEIVKIFPAFHMAL